MVCTIWSELRLNFKVSEHVIKAGNKPLKGSTATTVDLGTYDFRDSNTGKITPEKSFTNDYAEEVYESEHVRTTTKLLPLILYAR